MHAGTVLATSTVAANLRILRTEEDPFVLLLNSDRGASAEQYELVIPEAYLDRIGAAADLPPASRGVTKATRPKLAAQTWTGYIIVDPASTPRSVVRRGCTVGSTAAMPFPTLRDPPAWPYGPLGIRMRLTEMQPAQLLKRVHHESVCAR